MLDGKSESALFTNITFLKSEILMHSVQFDCVSAPHSSVKEFSHVKSVNEMGGKNV